MNSPLDSTVLFQIGPVPITQAIVTTWAIMAMLVIGAFLLTRRLDLRPTRRQAALELMVATLDTQITETTGAAPAPYRGFIGTLFPVHPRGELVLACAGDRPSDRTA
jgi:F-type H+-transporting ATPase subunit a